MLKKSSVIFLQKLDLLSALSMRFVQLTGKHQKRIHPKHLIKEEMWYKRHLKKNSKILDIGCGNGLSLIKVSNYISAGVGIDTDKEQISIAVDEAKKKDVKNLKFFIHDCNQRLPFKNSSFDYLVCSDVLEHLDRRSFAISEVKRVLKNNGTLFLVTDNPDTSWKKLQKSVGLFYYADPDHRYEYPKSEIIKIIEKSGFKIFSVDTVTYDTPLRGFIDLSGGISLTLYKNLKKFRRKLATINPKESTGYRIVAQKIK